MEHFKKTVEDFIQNGGLSFIDPNFVDNSNVLDFVSDGTTEYVLHLYLLEIVQFEHMSVEYKKDNKVELIGKFTNQTQVVYSIATSRFQLIVTIQFTCHGSILDLFDLPAVGYHCNYFIYVLEQVGAPGDKIVVVKSHVIFA